MCTLTIIPTSPGVRIACNRDESRLRPAALPPELRHWGPRRALVPIDPLGGGTWIAVTDAALTLVLMNVYTRPLGSAPPVPRKPAAVSRGTIIPRVAEAGTLDEALARARSLDLPCFEPFRLTLVDRQHYAECEWSDDQLRIALPQPLDKPWFCTSSGLGDEIVAAPRRKLFAESFTADADWSAVQDAFHRHVWPDRRPASVWMTRPEARTVSLTIIDVSARFARMRYYARGDDESTADQFVETTLPIA